MKNWARSGKTWRPISELPRNHAEPVWFADETQTISWVSEEADPAPVDHEEDERDEAGNIVFPREGGAPKRVKSKVKPAFWMEAVAA